MTECYAMVRAKVLRITELKPDGRLTEPIRKATSAAVSKVVIDEVVDDRQTELVRTSDDVPRVRLDPMTDSLGYALTSSFLRVDPGMLGLMTGHPVVLNAEGTVTGFDATARVPAHSYAMEVWSQLHGRDHLGMWGYTVFPFLKGGIMSGFEFKNGLVSFTVRGSRTQRMPLWAVGPYDMEGWHERLLEPVSGNTAWRNLITPAQPPAQEDGVVEFTDRISNGSATDPHPLRPGILAGGSAAMTSPWIVNGGRA